MAVSVQKNLLNGGASTNTPQVAKPASQPKNQYTDSGSSQSANSHANPFTTPASQARSTSVNNGTLDAISNLADQITTAATNTGANAPKISPSGTGGDNGPGSGPGGNGGGSSPSGGSSTPVDTSYDPYAADNAAAAGTVNRITQGVDMTEKINEANNAWQQATQNYGDTANNVVGQYQQNTNQGLDEYQNNAQGIIDQLSNISAQELADYANRTGQTISQATQQINDILNGMQQNMQPVNGGRVDRVDTTEQQNILKEMTDNQRKQANNQIEYAVQQGVNQLQRAEEDAQPQFQTQRNQIAAEERQAMDNQALYSEMRGDRGGIGQAGYNAIQNAAATNALKVNQAQTKLSTDTARQIADLRAQGEFDKADKMLEISQEYLGKLFQLQQWAADANISIDEFNIGVQQWEQEYNAKLQQTLGELGINAAQYEAGLNLEQQQYLTNQGLNAANTTANQNLALQGNVQQQRQALNDALAQYGLSNAQYMTNQDINRLTSTLNAFMQNAQNMASTELSAANVFGASGEGTLTAAMRDAQADRLAQAGAQMLAQGITPTDAQLKALGWSKDQYNGYKSAMAAAQAVAARSGGGRTSSKFLQEIQNMIAGGAPIKDINEQIANFNASGMMSQSEYNQATQLAGNLKEGQNYFTSPANG